MSLLGRSPWRARSTASVVGELRCSPGGAGGDQEESVWARSGPTLARSGPKGLGCRVMLPGVGDYHGRWSWFVPEVLGGCCSSPGWRWKMDLVSQPCGVLENRGLATTTARAAMAVVRGYMDDAFPTLGGVEMGDDMDESPARLMSCRRRRHPRVSFTSLEASSSCVGIPFALSLGVGCCLREKALIRCWIGAMAASSTSLL